MEHNELDSRLAIALKHLDCMFLESFCLQHKLTFIDFLFLTKEDLLLILNLDDNYTQRILNFSQNFENYAKDYSTIEVVSFFNIYKEFDFQKTNRNKSMDYNKVYSK